MSHPLRQALWPLGLAWGVVAGLRNWLFDAGLRKVHRLPVPVVSVGNLTAGGTGKTPTVAWLCALANAHGKRPGVLARGYGRAVGAARNDEGELLQRRLPWLLQEQDPDRVAAGQRLAAAGADYIVLDDGFQHRRLHRDLDIVCVDATLPFGNGLCLPAGDLREYRSGLRRAGMVLLTRAASLAPEQLAARVVRLRELAGKPLPIFACEHRPTGFVAQPRGEVLPLDLMHDRPCVLLSGIARPQSFRATMEQLGARIAGEFCHRDHHRFSAAELLAAARAADAAQALLVVTEKDDARMPADAPPRLVLRVDLAFLDGEPKPGEVLL